MGWFDDLVRAHRREEAKAFSESLNNLAEAVEGRSARGDALRDERRRALDAVGEILAYYRFPPVELPEGFAGDPNEALDCLLRPSGLMHRIVRLTGQWYRDGVGPMLGRLKDGRLVALIPRGLSGYTYFDALSGKRLRVDKRAAALFVERAMCFYKPLPQKALGIVDLVRYIAQTLSFTDYALAALATLAVTLLGLVAPRVNELMFGEVVPSGQTGLLWPVAALLAGVTVGSTMIGIAKTFIMTRVNTKTNIAVQSAAMMRLLSLPARFFRPYSVGELSNRLQSLSGLCRMLADTILSVGLTSALSLVYVGQIFHLAPALAKPALIILAVTILYSLGSTFLQLRRTRRAMELGAESDGLTYMLIAGLPKLRAAGAEKRAFAKWANQYARCAAMAYNPPLYVKLGGVIGLAISMLGAIAIYYTAVAAGLDVAQYMAFNVSFGMVSAAFSSLSGTALTFAQIRTILGIVEPILKTVPETAAGKAAVSRLSGKIEINNVTFRYDPEAPAILDNVTLTIKPGQYVGIVGKSGCGKTTLLRLLLGLESPQKGAIYYDGLDMNHLDLHSLRHNIGTVMQDGKLFQGDILSNITICAPWLSQEEAWAAAEAAGIAEDIRDMPMGMSTLISEGAGGISGGQRQRLLIARAIAPKPRILFFDEATSALDNHTQAIVSASLDAMKRTRIVVAHRLSTIRRCDRILVLDGGRIAEDGPYEELIARKGLFAELVEQQQVGETEEM